MKRDTVLHCITVHAHELPSLTVSIFGMHVQRAHCAVCVAHGVIIH
jgi:hypothetical protein